MWWSYKRGNGTIIQKTVIQQSVTNPEQIDEGQALRSARNRNVRRGRETAQVQAAEVQGCNPLYETELTPRQIIQAVQQACHISVISYIMGTDVS
jgi:hypothetical protein